MSQKSGLSAVIASELVVLKDVPTWAAVLALCVIVAGVTEFASNVATATIMIPIMAELVSV